LPVPSLVIVAVGVHFVYLKVVRVHMERVHPHSVYLELQPHRNKPDRGSNYV
jgi:hypothetical protein